MHVFEGDNSVMISRQRKVTRLSRLLSYDLNLKFTLSSQKSSLNNELIGN